MRCHYLRVNLGAEDKATLLAVHLVLVDVLAGCHAHGQGLALCGLSRLSCRGGAGYCGLLASNTSIRCGKRLRGHSGRLLNLGVGGCAGCLAGLGTGCEGRGGARGAARLLGDLAGVLALRALDAVGAGHRVEHLLGDAHDRVAGHAHIVDQVDGRHGADFAAHSAHDFFDRGVDGVGANVGVVKQAVAVGAVECLGGGAQVDNLGLGGGSGGANSGNTRAESLLAAFHEVGGRHLGDRMAGSALNDVGTDLGWLGRVALGTCLGLVHVKELALGTRPVESGGWHTEQHLATHAFALSWQRSLLVKLVLDAIADRLEKTGHFVSR